MMKNIKKHIRLTLKLPFNIEWYLLLISQTRESFFHGPVTVRIIESQLYKKLQKAHELELRNNLLMGLIPNGNFRTQILI